MYRNRYISILAALFLVFAVVGADARDWQRDPASIVIPHAPRVVAVGDIHGAFKQLADTLETAGMAKRVAPTGFDLTWTGGTSVLVFTGDLTDRGENTKQVYDAVMSLERQADAAGGHVFAMFGNHEALLLNGTVEKWAKTLTSHKQKWYQNTLDSFTKAGLDFHQAISPEGVYGSWIRRRPLFAVINGYLFIHGGLQAEPQGLTAIATRFRIDMEKDDFNAGIFMDEKGPLWNRDWWNDATLIENSLQIMGVRGVIFGHTVGAMGTEGVINTKGTELIGIDVGMSPAYAKSQGGALVMTATADGGISAEAVYPDKPSAKLFSIAGTGRLPRRPALRPANEQLPRTGTDN
ncbi:MAG TPA: metallophosphoesterase [Candidatus Ozemobacteraceae bacterium]|nr:metallophosphoesterase [Candidatus Ozemobacteraceae bacterium]HQG27934.1 metallophosphoesterase [Candidatus Ozemobacteraceae bacterium]